MTDYRARLVAFYEKYAPEKLSGVDELLEKSKGKEEKLFAKLVDKYGPESEPAEEPKQNSAPAIAKEVESGSKSSKKKSAKKEAEDGGEEERGESNKTQAEDEYGSRGWWKARLVRFYAKYAPEKTDADVEALMAKAKDNPVQLTKLINMLEQKYGPEPDPSSSEDESEEEEEDEEGAEEDGDDEGDDMIDIPGLRKIVYCPVDGVPPEYSEYFETFPQALPWLAAHTPDLVLNTKKGMTAAEYAKEQGVEPLTEGAKVVKSDKAKERKRGGAKKGDGKVIIETKEQRRKAITTIKGLEAIENLKMKDVSKALGKKFASGCSVKPSPTGDEMIEIQGDWSYDLPEVLVALFPAIKKDQVYVVVDGKKEPAF